MRNTSKDNGSVFLIVVFITALLSVLVTGMLQINTEELQLLQNQIYAAKALTVAEAGLNDALSELRIDSNWSTGFTNKTFDGGKYTVTVNGLTITSIGISSQGFTARVEADITIGSVSPYIIRIDNLRINE